MTPAVAGATAVASSTPAVEAVASEDEKKDEVETPAITASTSASAVEEEEEDAKEVSSETEASPAAGKEVEEEDDTTSEGAKKNEVPNKVRHVQFP